MFEHGFRFIVGDVNRSKTSGRRIATIVFALLFSVVLFVAYSSVSYAQSSSPKMSNGDYQPGAVLVYRNGGFRVATRSDVHRSANAYVLIHGAHTDSTNDSFVKLSKKILEADPDADVFYVDWAHWSKFNSAKMDKLLEEQAEFLVGSLATTAVIDFFDELFGDGTTVTEDHYGAVILANLGMLAARIVGNILPVEQTAYIPDVAERGYDLLFTTDNWTFTTDDQKGSFEGLGLDPAKTHIIGHSHGAHVGGLICKRVQNKLGKNVKRLSCLDPSTSEVHVSGENKDGNGWNRNVAGFIDVYRTSEFCCNDKLYGDFNLHVQCRQHPAFDNSANNVDDPDEVLSYLENLFRVEMTLHSGSIELFGKLIEDSSFLKLKSYSELDDEETRGKEGKWIELSYSI